jgi:ABC-type multidrug transport system ATPase subunit
MEATTTSTTAAAPTLELGHLELRLGARQLTLDRPCVLRAGHLYLVVGRSGSGKSSFARALLGFGDLTEPPIQCRGTVTVSDGAGTKYRLWRDESYDPLARRHVAFLPQAERLGFLDGLSVTDNLQLFSELRGAEAATAIARLAGRFELEPVPGRLASASGGERIRLSAIRGLLPRNAAGEMPAVIIADEPTAGLDRASAAAMVRTLVELARGGQSVVVVITHEPEVFFEHGALSNGRDDQAVRILQCQLDERAGRLTAETMASLTLAPVAGQPPPLRTWLDRVAETLGRLGAVALGPLAFLWGLLGMHRPVVLLRRVVRDAVGLGTHAFSLVGCLLVAGTVSYFIFERMPRPELVEPLLLPETLAVTGHALVRVVLPLGACCLVTAKLGAAQAARLAAAVRGGLLETLALAGWRVEAFALVPTVIAQVLAMAIATALALAGGVLLAAMVYVAGHPGGSLPLAVNLMIDGLQQSPEWWRYVVLKVVLSGFLGGTIAALFGIAPSRADDDVARAVHRTLLWSVLAVIACQCALIIAEFAP